MKKMMIALLMTSAIAAQAQNGNWSKPSETKQEKKYLFQKSKKADDTKYLAGAVPEKDGRVTFTHTLAVPGQNSLQLYNKLISVLQDMAKGENQIKSEVAIVNETDREIGATFEEWMTFKSTALVLDRTRFYYTVHVKCDDGRFTVSVTRLHFLYEEERTPLRYTAEEWISDKAALNKKQTKLLPVSAKFRRKTVDRMESLFKQIDAALL